MAHLGGSRVAYDHAGIRQNSWTRAKAIESYPWIACRNSRGDRRAGPIDASSSGRFLRGRIMRAGIPKGGGRPALSRPRAVFKPSDRETRVDAAPRM